VIYEDADSAVVRLENLMINLLEISNATTLVEPAPVAEPAAGARLLLTIEVRDTDAACAALERHGVKLLNGPIDRPWGRRTAAFADPAGNVWEVAAPHLGVHLFLTANPSWPRILTAPVLPPSKSVEASRWPGGEFVGGAQDRLRRVAALLPDELIVVAGAKPCSAKNAAATGIRHFDRRHAFFEPSICCCPIGQYERLALCPSGRSSSSMSTRPCSTSMPSSPSLTGSSTTRCHATVVRGLITYSEARTLAGVYVPFTDIRRGRAPDAGRHPRHHDQLSRRCRAHRPVRRDAAAPGSPRGPAPARDNGFRLFTLTITRWRSPGGSWSTRG